MTNNPPQFPQKLTSTGHWEFVDSVQKPSDIPASVRHLYYAYINSVAKWSPLNHMYEKTPIDECPLIKFVFSEKTDGTKLDQGKPCASLLRNFGRALLAVADVATYGKKKYNENHDDPNFVKVEDAIHRYRDARWRHELAAGIEPRDEESGLLHLQHIAWNALAELEVFLREKEKEELSLQGK